MQPTEIVQNAIGACEHIFRAQSLVEMDAVHVNTPALLGEIPHVQPAARETYCLWKHVHRIIEEIAMHQSSAKSLIGISFDELNAVDGLLYDNMPFPSGSYDSELKVCCHALNQLTPTLCMNLRRSISFDEIDEEWLAKGYYTPDLRASLDSLLSECKSLANRHADKLSGIDRRRLQKELRVLTRLGSSETGDTDHADVKLSGCQMQKEQKEQSLIGPATCTIGELDRKTPSLDTQSVDWIRADKISKEIPSSPKTRSLSKYRLESEGGRQSEDRTFGIDKDGRIWRRVGTPNAWCYYWRQSLDTRAPANQFPQSQTVD